MHNALPNTTQGEGHLCVVGAVGWQLERKPFVLLVGWCQLP
jgi:hypothetical protein